MLQKQLLAKYVERLEEEGIVVHRQTLKYQAIQYLQDEYYVAVLDIVDALEDVTVDYFVAGDDKYIGFDAEEVLFLNNALIEGGHSEYVLSTELM